MRLGTGCRGHRPIFPRLKIFGRFHLGLFPIGASVSPDPVAWANAKPLQRFMVAIAGPMTSFVCGLVFLSLSLLFPHSMRGLSAFAQLHFLLGAANLVPVPPLDGWVAFTELFGVRGRPLSEQANRVASRVGSGVLYGLGFWFIGDLINRIP